MVIRDIPTIPILALQYCLDYYYNHNFFFSRSDYLRFFSGRPYFFKIYSIQVPYVHVLAIILIYLWYIIIVPICFEI